MEAGLHRRVAVDKDTSLSNRDDDVVLVGKPDRKGCDKEAEEECVSASEKGYVEQVRRKQDAERARKREVAVQSLQTTYLHMMVNVGVNVMVVTARPALLLNLLNGKSGRTNELLALWAGTVGAAEFLINPACGRLGDKIGRKPLLLLSPVTNLALKTLVAFNPSVFTLMLERIISGALTTISGSTTCSAVLSDVSTGQNLASDCATLGAYAGLGCILGPLIGGQLVARIGSLRLPFAVAAGFAAIDLVLLLTRFKETVETPREFEFSAANPFGFLKLFQGPSTLSKLVLISGLLCFPEGKNLSDFNQFYILKHVKMSQDMRTLFTVGFGVTMFLGGLLAKKTLVYLGERNHTSFSNWLTMAGMLCWASPRPSTLKMFLGLVILTGAMERRAAIGSLATQQALKAGMSRGEFAGLFANWRAVATCFAPLLYGKAYALAHRFYPGLPYIVAGLICMTGEFFHITLSNKELGLL